MSGATAVKAQQLDLTQGGPIDITSTDGIEWHQAEQQVIARGNARAVRNNVTVTADRLIAWYRKKAAVPSAPGAPGQPSAQPQGSRAQVSQPQATPAAATPAASTSAAGASAAAAPGGIGINSDTSTEGTEIYRLQAEGGVHIFTQTDQAQGDKATYDLDQAVLVLTGHGLKLTTPNDVLTARDDLEYWPQKHMAVARGNAVVLTNDGKRIAADTLVAYTQEAPASPAAKTATVTQASVPAGAKPTDDPVASSGKLQRMEAFGHVSIRTATDTVTGDRGVYVTDTGMARIAGNVHITRGQNQLNGAEADVNMKTGVARLVASNAGRVHGLVMPNDASNRALGGPPGTSSGSAPATAGTKPAKTSAGARS